MEMEQNYLNEMFSLNPFLAEIYSNGSSKPQMSDHGSQKPDSAKQLNSSASWNSCYGGQEIISTKSSSSATSAPQLISFENSNFSSSSQTNTPYYHSNLDQMDMDQSLTSQIISFSSSAKDDSGKKRYHAAADGISSKRVCPAARTPLQAQDHIMAERKRRENLSQLFISLSKVVPGLKKLDKASLLEDAINYLKALQERVGALEKEEMKVSSAKDDCSSYVESSMNNNGSTRESATPEIGARITDRHVLVKFCCKKQMGLMSRIPSEMEKMNLSVIDMRIMPFGAAAIDVTILAEMQSEFVGTVKDLVDRLQAVFLNPTSILNSRR